MNVIFGCYDMNFWRDASLVSSPTPMQLFVACMQVYCTASDKKLGVGLGMRLERCLNSEQRVVWASLFCTTSNFSSISDSISTFHATSISCFSIGQFAHCCLTLSMVNQVSFPTNEARLTQTQLESQNDIPCRSRQVLVQCPGVHAHPCGGGLVLLSEIFLSLTPFPSGV